jgi:ABC-2 type transport system ATP-binding protein
MPVIEVDQLVRSYTSGSRLKRGPRTEVQAVRGISFEVEKGELFGLLGPNGAGTTTTIRLLLDLLRPTSGTMTVLGLQPRTDGVALRARIGYLPGDLNLPAKLTGRAFLADHAAIRRLHLHADIDALAERLTAELDRPLGELSLGNRRKIGVIAAFVHRPELLVLDEPTGGLDPLVQQEFRALVHEAVAEGRTVFLSSHVLDEVQHLADRVAVLRGGRVVAEGTVDRLLGTVVRSVRVTFARAPSADSFRSVPGVVGVDEVSATELHFAVSGVVGPLLAVLAVHEPVDLFMSEPGLESAFLGYYNDRREGGAQ